MTMRERYDLARNERSLSMAVPPPFRKREMSYGGKIEVDYVCVKCLSVIVNNQCHHCTPKEVPVEMQQLVKAYNDLTGKKLTRFSSVAIGEQRLAAAQLAKAVPKAKAVSKATTKVPTHLALSGAHTGEFKSVMQALVAANLPLNLCIRIRHAVKTVGTYALTHEGKLYTFTKR